MDLPDVPLLSHAARTHDLAASAPGCAVENVANADTPGYVARDLKPLDFEQALQQQRRNGASLMTTNARHIAIDAHRT